MARTSRIFLRAPDAVVFAKTTEEVRDVVNICRARVPMIPYGVGTPSKGTSRGAGRRDDRMSQMNEVLTVTSRTSTQCAAA